MCSLTIECVLMQHRSYSIRRSSTSQRRSLSKTPLEASSKATEKAGGAVKEPARVPEKETGEGVGKEEGLFKAYAVTSVNERTLSATARRWCRRQTRPAVLRLSERLTVTVTSLTPIHPCYCTVEYQ